VINGPFARCRHILTDKLLSSWRDKSNNRFAGFGLSDPNHIKHLVTGHHIKNTKFDQIRSSKGGINGQTKKHQVSLITCFLEQAANQVDFINRQWRFCSNYITNYYKFYVFSWSFLSNAIWFIICKALLKSNEFTRNAFKSASWDSILVMLLI